MSGGYLQDNAKSGTSRFEVLGALFFRVGIDPHLGERRLVPMANRLTSWIDQPPGHCPYLIEEFESGVGSVLIDCACLGEKPKVSVNLFRRGVGDSIMVRSVPAGPSMTCA